MGRISVSRLRRFGLVEAEITHEYRKGADQRDAGVNAYATFLLRFAQKSKSSFSAKARLCSAALTSSLSSSYLQETSIISSRALSTFAFSSFNFSFRVIMVASDQ